MPSRSLEIAVCQYGWALGSYTRDFVVGLAERGHRVHVLMDQPSLDEGAVSQKSLQHTNVIVHPLRGWPKQPSFMERVVGRLRLEKRRFIINIRSQIAPADRRFLARLFSSRQFDLVVGVERGGLYLAGHIQKRWRVPFVHYSLEIFAPEAHTSQVVRRELALQAECHRSARATIIQDEARAREISLQHGLELDHRFLYYPISVGRNPAASGPTSDYWRRKFGLPADSVVVLYFGKLHAISRGLIETVEAWRDVDPRYAMVFHGVGDPRYLREAIVRTRATNVFVSQDFVPEDAVRDLIGSSDIGLCWYTNENANDGLTAFSSEKIALCLQAGVPILTNKNESYDRLYGRFQCGQAVPDFVTFPSKIVEIVGNHAAYRDAALCAFEELYSFEKNIEKVAGQIEALLHDETAAALSGRKE